MKVAEALLVALVLGLAGFIGAQSIAVRTAHTRGEAAGAIDSLQPLRKAGRSRQSDTMGVDRPWADFASTLDLNPERRVSEPASATARTGMGTGTGTTIADAGTAREMRRRIDAGATGTYIDELLLARDSALSRWPNRETRPLRVWVDEAGTIDGWSPDFAPTVRDAFDEWSAAGIPVRFDFVHDSASADVHVRFTSRLPDGISGKTVWSRDARWWLVAGDIQLALVHPSGGIVTPAQLRAIALHEVGHLLGLDHAAGGDNIMSARVRVRELSVTDRATIRLLYSMPAGSVR